MTEILTGTIIKTGKDMTVNIDGLGEVPIRNMNGFLASVGERIYVFHDGAKYVPMLPQSDKGKNAGAELLTQLDFFRYGYSAKYENTIINMTWTKDESGKITRLTNSDTGQSIRIRWHE